MRILLVCDCYLPSTKACAKLMHDLAAELVGCDHDVTLLAPDETLDRDFQYARENGVTVIRVKTGPIKQASKLVRAINESRLSAVLWKKARTYLAAYPCDQIVFYSPSIFFGPLIGRLKRLWHCPAYLILRDIFPQWAVDAGLLRKGLAYRYFRYVELQQYKIADVIGVQSTANLDYFHASGFAGDPRLDVLYNWTRIEEVSPARTSFRQRWGLQNKTVFVYGGNLGLAQDMDNIVRLANRLRNDLQVHFLLVGDGDQTRRLRSEIATQHLANITIKSSVSQSEYLAMLAEFDVGLISLDRRLKTHNFPGKMLGYMQQRLPMLASVNAGNDLLDLLQKNQAGLVCLNGQDQQLEDYARRLARDADLRQRLGQAGRNLLERQFSAAQAANQILAQCSAGVRESTLRAA